jgi:ADP-heptose:LPS heptosyltransferase
MFRTRLQRFLAGIRDNYRRRGLPGSAWFILLTLRRKAGLFVTSAIAKVRTRSVRATMRAQRETVPGEVTLAVLISGGVGDTIVIARFIRDLMQAAPGASVDVFLARPANAAQVFAAIPGFRHAYHDALFEPLRAEYDVALRANQTIVVHEENLNWPALRHAPGLVAALREMRRARADIEDFIQLHPARDNFLARKVVFSGKDRRTFLHAMAGIPYGGDLLPLGRDATAPSRFGLVPGRYVTLHNGYDPDFVIAGQRATKCYPHFGQVVAGLKQRCPGIVFVQIGTTTSEPVAECDVNLIGRTTMAEVAGLLAGAVAHIDNEGGLVHMAACLGIPSVVVFGPTPSDYFGYRGNVNVDPPVCGDCWWITRTWMERCVRGYATARCLQEQPPEAVVARAAPLLAAPPPAGPPPDPASAPRPRGAGAAKLMARGAEAAKLMEGVATPS